MGQRSPQAVAWPEPGWEDEPSLEVLYRQYAPWLGAMLRKRFGLDFEARADDVADLLDALISPLTDTRLEPAPNPDPTRLPERKEHPDEVEQELHRVPARLPGHFALETRDVDDHEVIVGAKVATPIGGRLGTHAVGQAA